MIISSKISTYSFRSNYEVTEPTWEKGQLAMHGLHSYPTKPTSIWKIPNNDTLESIVHQATSTTTDNNLAMAATVSMKKRARPEYSSKDHHHQYLCGGENYSTNYNNNGDDSTSNKDAVVVMSESELEEYVDPSGCGSASYKGTFCRESGDGATMMTWGSFESNPSFKTKATTDGDSAGSENQDEDRETKSETARSQSSRRGRAAAIHNLSERRRRDRINQKMKALQKLVPSASKTDKASMLDEVIGYLKRLQFQLQSMISLRNNNMLMNMHPHHHIMNMHLHQLHQYSLLARMGMMNMSASAAGPQSLPSPPPPPPLIHPAANPTYVPHPFVVPQMASRLNPEPPATRSSAVPLTDAYCALLAQSMNMEAYNKMAALYLQQVNQNTKARNGAASGSSNHVQDDI